MIEPADEIIKRKLSEELEFHTDYTAVENVVRELNVSTPTTIRALYEIIREEETKSICRQAQ